MLGVVVAELQGKLRVSLVLEELWLKQTRRLVHVPNAHFCLVAQQIVRVEEVRCREMLLRYGFFEDDEEAAAGAALVDWA